MAAASRTEWIPYCGAAPDPGELWSRWNLDPILLIALIALAIMLAWLTPEEPGRRKLLVGAIVVIAILFVSPFCALTSALFAARVGHHVLLTAAVAPLLVYSLPRSRIDVPGSLILWTGMQALIFWAWHSPALYSSALSDHAVYWLMQVSLVGAAVGFWSVLRRAPAPAAVAALLATMVQMGLLGALITFSATPLYEPHFESAFRWGFDPLEDQQLGGLIMWAPAAGVYLAAALAVAGNWLSRETRMAG